MRDQRLVYARGVTPPLLFVTLLACALGAGCRYHASHDATDTRDQSCGGHCAAVHEGCVRSGQAKTLGLPGVTYHLCRERLEACLAGCPREGDLTVQPAR